jgi:6-phosphogluconolactonase (cycloisomerase 2 family)
VVVAITLTGCTTIALISAPEFLNVGDTATFVLDVSAWVPGTADWVYVVAEVPDSWTLQASTYQGSSDGQPVSGSGTVVSDPNPGCVPTARDGYQIQWISDGPFTYSVSSDGAAVTLEYQVNDLPAGEITTRFWFVSSGDFNASCSEPPVVATINREPRSLVFDQTTPIPAARETPVLTHGGRYLLISNTSGSPIVIFSRDVLTGDLVFVDSIPGPSISGLDDLVKSPEENHLYGVDRVNDQLVVFDYGDPPSTSTLVEAYVDGVGGVDGLSEAEDLAISPDGTSVYAAGQEDDGIAVFSRDPVSGLLSFQGAMISGVGGIPSQSLNSPKEISISSDGLSVYVAAEQGIDIFDRDSSTGLLTFKETDSFCGIKARSIDLDPTGEYLYVVTSLDNICTYRRTPATGDLLFISIYQGQNGILGLSIPSQVRVSSDGTKALVAGEISLAVFDRNPDTGLLTPGEVNYSNDNGVPDLWYQSGLLVSHDSSDVFDGQYVFTWRIFGDGFESGGVTAWSQVRW